MALTYHEIQQARIEAEQTIARADKATRHVARLIQGRLRASGIPGYVLEELKRELRDYNMHTGEWRERK
jgi:hypothetical protein